MKKRLTQVIEKHGTWYVAYVREISGVNTQGRTLKDEHSQRLVATSKKLSR